MLDLITFTGPYEMRERSAATIRARFRDQAEREGVQPTNVYYHLGDDGTGLVLADWTPVTPPVDPDAHVDIVITPEQNRIVRDSCELERKTLSVMTDRGLATQFVGSYTFAVRNLGWSS